jgi:hypothetical protein
MEIFIGGMLGLDSILLMWLKVVSTKDKNGMEVGSSLGGLAF